MAQTHPTHPTELLTSWKEIANYIGKGVRTVQRWEATLGLPVFRPADGRPGIVMARPGDLEDWVLHRRQQARRSADGWRQKDNQARATFTECLREMRSYHAEVRVLCRQVEAAQQSLQHEIERLRSLCQEWDTLCGETPEKAKPSAFSKIN